MIYFVIKHNKSTLYDILLYGENKKRGYEIMEQIKNYLVEAIMTTQDEKMLKLLYSFLKGYQLRKTNSNKTA